MSQNLQQIIDRVMTGATGINNDAFQSILADAEMTAETLFDLAADRVLYRACTLEKDFEFVCQTHHIVVDPETQVGDLPASVSKEFIHLSILPDYQFASYKQYLDYGRYRFNNQICYYSIKDGEIHTTCVLSNGTLIRSIASVEKEGLNPAVIADAGTGGFTDLADIGRRIAIFVSGTQVWYDTIRATIDADTCEILGHLSSIIAVGNKVAKIYEPRMELVRTVATVAKAAASQIVTAGAGQGQYTAADVGRLLIIRNVGGDVVLRALISTLNNTDSISIYDYTAAFGAWNNAEIWEIIEPTLTLYAPTYPVLPDDIDDDIEFASDKYLDFIVAEIIAILTGQTPLQNLKKAY